jgi:hypothetical protein
MVRFYRVFLGGRDNFRSQNGGDLGENGVDFVVGYGGSTYCRKNKQYEGIQKMPWFFWKHRLSRI